jgi:putative undecaprenyl-phosphate alpha-N-acetylglucosaminyl 1-phosphate transferase
MLPIITVALTATILGGVLPFLVRPLLHTLNMVDLPNERSSHTTPTYRGMGLATALAVCASFGVATAAGWTVNTGISVTLLAGMAAALLLGWIEDVSGIGIAIRAGVQLLIGAGVAGVLSVLMNVPVFWAVPAAIFVAAYINVANFMDGINGISGCHGLAAGLCYSFTGYLTELPWLTLGGLAIAGAFAAFLPWNVRSGRNVFLGDAGSYLLGAGLSILAVGTWFANVNPLVALAPLLVYLADSGTTLLRRMAAGEQWYKPHRTHVYQRLTDVGFTHLGSATVVTGLTVLVWALILNGLNFWSSDLPILGVVLLAFAVLVVLLYLSLPTLIARQKTAAPSENNTAAPEGGTGGSLGSSQASFRGGQNPHDSGEVQ